MATERLSSGDDARVGNSPVRHTCRVLSDAEKQQMAEIKDMGLALLNKLHEIGRTSPNAGIYASRDLQLAADHIEDGVMRAVRHVTA